ncbi:MAG: hypothetical protein MUF22_05400 [Chitinispirillaceae bacterium]|jgi:hypothetical protein|nr:hypothetical protein [Chitinispirillaceae bacterium]
MKTLPFLACTIIIGVCSAAQPAKNRDSVFIYAVNERVWLAPLENNTGITLINEWPEDTMLGSVLLRHFDDIHEGVAAEFRLCEKFGLYAMVEDSGQATTRVKVILDGFSRAGDSLIINVECLIDQRVQHNKVRLKYHSAAYAPPPDKNTGKYQYSGMILANYRSSFPYRDIVYPFYSQLK